MKQKYYRLDKIKKLDAEYNILLGERSNGKSYAVKEDALREAFKGPEHKKFILLRRWDLEIKPTLMVQYFKDAPITAITDGKYDGIDIYRGDIFFTKFDEKTQKDIKMMKIGCVRALSQEQHYSSGAYNDYSTIIFEEFISRDYYLPSEPLKLMQFVSTVARRRKLHVYMIGNTISRLCPYFSEWQLVNIPRQKQGTIETYSYATDEIDDDGSPVSITIAVEFCENSGRNSKMFFGIASKMITSGTWQSKEMPHLPKSKDTHYDSMYTVYVECQNFKFKCELLVDRDDGSCAWYVTPKTTAFKPDDRIITDHMRLYGMITTIGFVPLSPVEASAFSYIKQGLIYYCDNMTGCDFEACLKQLGIQ